MESERVTRWRLLRGTALGLGGLAGCRGRRGSRDSPESDDSSRTDAEGSPEAPPGGSALADLRLRGRSIATGFASPVAVETPGSGDSFVADQSGQIYSVGDQGRRDAPFLDVSDRTVDVSGVSERGLLGLAFHPDYAENGRFFVRYSAPPRGNTPDGYSHTFVLSEFRADPDARTADASSERTLLEIPEPQSNHNAGSVAFGPDGYLYVGVGDGGGGGDRGRGHVDDWYDAVDGGNGQDVTENPLGSVLRIDVDGRETVRGEKRPYAVPDDNPLVGNEGLDEQYAWGFRNPWRISFGPDGRLFVADVGQSAYEEVNVVERGGNYGWNVREGTHCYDASDCPSETPDGSPLRPPVIEYPHRNAEVSGISVIGGYLYDGDAVPALDGTYVFADWRANGELFVARERPEGLWPVTSVPMENLDSNVLSFGLDADGELLVCTSGETGVSGDSGTVYRVERARS